MDAKTFQKLKEDYYLFQKEMGWCKWNDVGETGIYAEDAYSAIGEFLDWLGRRVFEKPDELAWEQETNESLKERISAILPWITGLPIPNATPEEITLLEGSCKEGVYIDCAFSINGHGWTIDFENHTVSRSTAYDTTAV